MVVAINGTHPFDARPLEEIELDLLLEGVCRYWGNDFRGYERAFLHQRLCPLMQAYGLTSLSALQDKVLHDRDAADALLRQLSARESTLFSEPQRFLALREAAGPLLRSYALPKVWMAESASAEDVFSLAILLEEEGVYERSMLFATGGSESLLREAKAGVFPLDRLGEYEENYRRSGGRRTLSNYYTVQDGQGIFAPELRRNITWAQYSVATDTSFNEFQMIVCGRQLTDFGAPLRRRVLGIFTESVSQFGVLSLRGVGEAEADRLAIHYRPVSMADGLYRRAG